MLTHLYISQFALIDELDIDIESGFSVITGETGAGKSIIMGALALIMGDRADSRFVRIGASKCVVEAKFDVKGIEHLKLMFLDQNLDYDEECIIRREVTNTGKSRAFVNDTPVNLQTLRSIASNLIDIHSQHENLLLNSSDFQLNVVDTIAKSQGLLKTYKGIYHDYILKRNRLIDLQMSLSKNQSDRDYAQFQFDQLESANLQEDEQDSLENELDTLTHLEEIKSNLALTINNVEQDHGLQSMLKCSIQSLERTSKYIKETAPILERMNSMYVELKDINSEIVSISNNMELDPQRKNFIEERLNLIYTLEQKHHVDSVQELLERKNEYESKIINIDSLDFELEKTQGEVDMLYEKLSDLANKLSSIRLGIKDKIAKYLIDKLVYLGMPNVNIELRFEKNNDFTSNGLDVVEFLFSANKNVPLKSISNIASGGEMARVMLAIKSLIVSDSKLQTIIFDEVDTGVSGDIAGKMGQMMLDISKDIQVVAITHLPQIAAKGSYHFKVYKEDEQQTTVTHIESLNRKERELEIAELMSGKNPTTAALVAARELMDSAS